MKYFWLYIILKIKKHNFLYVLLFLCLPTLKAQDVFWLEDFDDGGGGRWTLENAPGSGTNPTPAGIVGLTYEVNNPIFDNFIINDRNTPELFGNIVLGQPISSQGAFNHGRHYDCSAPSNLPNPFINTGVGPNQSLHITAHPSCATLLYIGTPQSDDWNCISDPDNGDAQTKTEQIAFLNQNIDATGKCNIKLTADFYLGGDAEGVKSHSTILYSIDAGVTWKIVEDNLKDCNAFTSGSCNNWFRRSFEIPSDADNQPDLRIAFRWFDDGDIDNTGDYSLGASFNVDNVMLSSCNKPNTDIIVPSGTSSCKNQAMVLISLISTNAGAYSNCTTTLTDNCAVSGFAWNIIGPGPVVFVNGTSATDSIINIEFSVNGGYTAELTATNCAGDSTTTKLNLITIADCPPAAQFISSSDIVCTAPTSKIDTIAFTDASSSIAAITNWNWTFNPATVTFVNGTSATDQNPEVIFNASGSYEVSLQVTTVEGTDTETKTAFIEAISCECGGGAIPPTDIFFENFTSGGGAWTLNSADLGSATVANSGTAFDNSWIVDADYTGGILPPTPAPNVAQSGGNYLHMKSIVLCTGFLNACGAFFSAGQNKKHFTRSPIINTTGFTGVQVDFWMLNASTGTIGLAEIFYSTNGGTTWVSLATYINEPIWALKTIVPNPAFDNQANLMFGFQFDDNGFGTGVATDPAFSIDDFRVFRPGVGSLPNTWEGNTNVNWSTASNWSAGTVPVSTEDVLIPSPANLVGTFMPTISATAFAKNVCNFGTLTLTGDNTLTIDIDLLNEGVITTTTTTNLGDIIFANANSLYKGSGTMFDVDISVISNDLTLESNLTTRSLIISTTGTVDLAAFELSINKNLTKTAGTFTAVNGIINFIDACGTCVDLTSNSTVSLNANQTFGNVFVNKTTGIVTALISNVNHTFTSPKTLTILSGILDVNTNTLSGTGNLTMIGGELQLAKCATVIPELTGNYTLTAGQVTFDGVCNQTVKVSAPLLTYYDVEFTGTGVKSLDNDNLNINNQLILNLPITTGNYVDAGTDFVNILNNNAGIFTRTGGHIVGKLSRAITANGGLYSFYVGSDNTDGETYYEPIFVTPNNISGATAIIANFNDASPNPAIVSPFITFGFAPTQDTIEDVEDEGFWQLNTNNPLTGGSYEATVSPDTRFWSFSKVWGSGQYTLLKQNTLTIPWDYTVGGVRVSDSTTTNFSNFSNFALGFAKNAPLPDPLPVELITYKGLCNNGVTLLSWATASEINADFFIIEKSNNGIDFSFLANIPASGNSNEIRQYSFEDYETSTGSYYRLSQQDFDGTINTYGLIFISCTNNATGFEFEIFPNPTIENLNLTLFSNRKENVNITIYDLSGSLVYQRNFKSIEKGISIKSITLNQLANGSYIINAQTERGESKNLRLIITR